ncbi:MAG: transcriptional regulator [Novibacillus thermophilus]
MLKFQGRLAVSDMAKQLGITEMAVRRHLHTLERDGLIQSTLVRQSKGRPANLYSLTSAAEELFPKNYHTLTLELLDDICETDGKEVVDELFRRREERLTNTYARQFDGKNLEDRVKELAELQNSKGYMVEWDKLGEGRYTFVEYNCPIAQVANRYNQACRCELGFFRNVLEGARVERPECKAKGGANCVYYIEAERKEA